MALTWSKSNLFNMEKIERLTTEIDASGKPMGRLASEVANRLIGKHRVDYAPNLDIGDVVKVSNASKMTLSGKNKMIQKKYYSHSGYAGGLKEVTLKRVWEKDPSEVLRRSVSRMLPKNRLRNERMKRLTVTN